MVSPPGGSRSRRARGPLTWRRGPLSRRDVDPTYPAAEDLAQSDRIIDCVRRRWGIENKLHYVLDTIFDEDSSRIRTGNAAENFSRFFHLALNLLRADTTERASVENKRFSAATDDEYLELLIGSPLA